MYRLPLRNRILYATGSLGSQAVLTAILLRLLYFYGPDSGDSASPLLPLGLVGALIFLGRVVDVVSDPLVGAWSDRVRSRWGRRIPFLLFGSPLMAGAFILLWIPPTQLPTPLLAAYFFLMMGLFFIGHTLSGRPYDALLPEIAPGSRERTSISGFRVALGLGGAALGLVASGLLIDQGGYILMGVVLGLVALGTRYTAIAGVWKWAMRNGSRSEGNPLREAGIISRNRPFRYYLPSFVLFSMGLTLLTQLIPFHVSVVLQGGELQESLIMGVFLGMVVLSIPLVARLAALMGKRHMYSLALLLTGLALPLLFFAGFLPWASPMIQVVVLGGLLGVTMSGAFIMPPVLMSDIIDHDEELTGQRREAVYYGAEQGIQKVAVGLSSVVLTQVLEIFGRTPDDPLGIRLVGPLAGLLVLAGLVIFARGYRLEPRVQ
jgi:glycoside/pentoside/hexuronide:cation symporter, GPH family